VHLVAHALSEHNPALAQHSKMLAHLRLSLAEQRNQVFDSLRPIAEQEKHFQPCRIGQRLTKIGLQAIKLQFLLSFHFLMYLNELFELSNSRMLARR